MAYAKDAMTREILLTISGEFGSPATEQTISMDRAALDQLPQISFETKTIWTEGEMWFSGPTLLEVVSAIDANAANLKLTAANDYQVVIPMHLLTADAPIIATRINGHPFSLREKGPLWLVFPYDQDIIYRTETIYTYSIWQLTEINLVQ